MWEQCIGFNLRRPIGKNYNALMLLDAEKYVIRSIYGSSTAAAKHWIWAHPSKVKPYLNQMVDAGIFPFFCSREGTEVLDEILFEVKDGGAINLSIEVVCTGFLNKTFPDVAIIPQERLEPLMGWRWHTFLEGSRNTAVVIFGSPTARLDVYHDSLVLSGYHSVTPREARLLLCEGYDPKYLHSSKHGNVVMSGSFPSREERQSLAEILAKRGYGVYLLWSTKINTKDRYTRLPVLCQEIYQRQFQDPINEPNVYRID